MRTLKQKKRSSVHGRRRPSRRSITFNEATDGPENKGCDREMSIIGEASMTEQILLAL